MRRAVLRRGLYATSVLAAAAAVVMLIMRWGGGAVGDDEVVRGAPAAAARIELDAVGAPARFSWRPLDERLDGYRVRVFTEAGEPAWTSGVLAAPPATLETALPPGDYRWEVEALRDGNVVASSRLAPLRTGP